MNITKEIGVNDLVLIEWEDSNGCPQGWVHVTENISNEISIITSVGFVRYIDKHGIQIVPHVAYNTGHLQCVQGFMSIPRSGIISWRKLK